MRRPALAVVGGLLVMSQAVLTSQESRASSAPTAATDLTHAAIETEAKTAFTGNVADRIMSLVNAGKYNVAVALVRRSAAGAGGGALSHDKITEVYYILRGSGTQVTGGVLVDPKPTAGSSTIGPGVSGSNVRNGRSSRLGPGDMQIIPPGVAHTWMSIDAGGIEYLVLRVDPDHVLALQ